MVVGVVGLLLAWVAVAAWSSAQVTVERVGALSCTGTEVSQRPDGTPAVALRPGMRCDVVVQVRNGGWLPVRHDSLVLPFMGSRGDAAVRVAEYLANDDVEAVLDVGSRIGPGAESVVGFTLVYRDDGCTGLGEMTVPDFPSVSVSVLGLPGRVSSDESVGFDGTVASAHCDD